MTNHSSESSSSFHCFTSIDQWITERASELDQIPSTRRQELSQLAGYIRKNLEANGTAKLTFICTHNSRRSHFSQIWAKVIADYCGHFGVQTFSGGTEATAMNERVVDSLRRSGFVIEADDVSVSNPIYRVSYSDQSVPLQCFSKVYDQTPNPQSGYAAVMTCSSADDACPIVPGCELRLPIRYEDPKVADGTEQEAAVYDERSKQISREMLAVMKAV
ncbi:protein-tyrosine-phosphatase [Stieleria sp. JC731]|uniref:protein-tyrosine-phosphatase n=1 Tax=Pirellulaceae TaxID=2691357 RepID=UPI001E5CCC46|nr:protein-tyrosine-phosphatase [Stieleria sp. JC731]MCC9600432.1 protein-tyrosine-phosphatase [Stieleria sp. JC731]